MLQGVPNYICKTLMRCYRRCVMSQAREFEEERAKAAAAQEEASAQVKDLQAEVERVEEHQVR